MYFSNRSTLILGWEKIFLTNNSNSNNNNTITNNNTTSTKCSVFICIHVWIQRNEFKMLEFRRCWKISWILQQLFPSLKLSIFSPCSSIDLNGIKTLQSKQFKTEETVYSKSYLSSSLSLPFFSLSLCACVVIIHHGRCQ